MYDRLASSMQYVLVVTVRGCISTMRNGAGLLGCPSGRGFACVRPILADRST